MTKRKKPINKAPSQLEIIASELLSARAKIEVLERRLRSEHLRGRAVFEALDRANRKLTAARQALHGALSNEYSIGPKENYSVNESDEGRIMTRQDRNPDR